jgi:hypothetical protein
MSYGNTLQENSNRFPQFVRKNSVNPTLTKSKYKELELVLDDLSFGRGKNMNKVAFNGGSAVKWRQSRNHILSVFNHFNLRKIVEGEEDFEKDRPTVLNTVNPQMEIERESINQIFRMNCKFALR